MKKQLMHNLPLKLLSLLLAMVVWYYVNFVVSPIVERSVVIPIRVINQPPATWVDSLPETVRVTVQAPRKDVASNLYVDGLTAYLNLMSAQPNMLTRVPISVNLPPNLPVIHQEPKFAEVNPQVLKSVEIPVLVEARGSLRHGYYLRKITVAPSRVIVTAPASRIDDRLACTFEVDVSGLADDRSYELPVFPLERSTISGFSVDVSQISVRVLVHPWPSREAVVTPLLTGEVAFGYEIASVTSVPDKVFVKGMPETIAQVRDIPTRLLSVEGLTTGISQQVELDVSPDSGLFLETDRVQLTVAIKELIRDRTIMGVQPLILAPETWEVQLKQPRIDVTLTGPKRLLHGISGTIPVVLVDARNSQTGEVELPVFLQDSANLPGVILKPERVPGSVRPRPSPFYEP